MIAHKLQTIVTLAVAAVLFAAGLVMLVFHGAARNGTAGWAVGPVALLLALCGLTVFLLVRRRKRSLCNPLIQIAQTAKAVALFHDYSLRVGKSADDEMRVPIDALNEMFGAIERRDAELARRREALEEEICLRNGEFRTVRARLQVAEERVEVASRAQGQILANACHQIRTFMNGILGMTALALDTQLTAEQRGDLVTVKDSAESLLIILDGILGVSQDPVRPPRAVPRPSRAGSPELRVLVVEDHPVNQQLVTLFLTKQGHRTWVAANGREALEAMAHDDFDAILMDIQMPVMSGFEATRAIRRSERGSGRHIPIIAMTAYALKGDRERCLDSGMDAYITKPIRPDALLEALERTCASPIPA